MLVLWLLWKGGMSRKWRWEKNKTSCWHSDVHPHSVKFLACHTPEGVLTNLRCLVNFQMFKLDLKTAEELEIKLPTSVESYKKQENSRKTFTFALLIMQKPLTVDHNKLWKILREMRIPDHLTCLLRNLYAGPDATVRISLPNPAIEPASPALASGFFPTEPPGKRFCSLGLSLPAAAVLTLPIFHTTNRSWISYYDSSHPAPVH